MKWIKIVEQKEYTPRKTKRFIVFDYKDNPLGLIAWYGAWRKYSFFPEAVTVFEWTCLRDIADFCEQETKTYKKYGYKK